MVSGRSGSEGGEKCLWQTHFIKRITHQLYRYSGCCLAMSDLVKIIQPSPGLFQHEYELEPNCNNYKTHLQSTPLSLKRNTSTHLSIPLYAKLCPHSRIVPISVLYFVPNDSIKMLFRFPEHIYRLRESLKARLILTDET